MPIFGAEEGTRLRKFITICNINIFALFNPV